jgi:hypothetical protein
MTAPQINVRRHIGIACYLLVGCYLLVAVYLLSGLTGPGRFYRSGVPAGADFVQIWAASSLAAQGQAPQVYDPDELHKVETEAIGGNFDAILPFHYPPPFLMLMLPLASLNYLAALALWLFLPLAALLAILYKIAPDRLTVWLALAAISTAQNLFYGQGAFLIAVLLGGGLLLVDDYPILAGLLFSLILNYKPHLGLLLPVALAAGRHWRALAALAAACLVLVLASIWVLGTGTWLAYWQDLSLMRTQLAEANLWDRMPTVYGSLRLWGVAAGPALLLQLIASVAVLAGVFWVWRRRASLPLRASVLILGTLLATPHALNYDLTLILLPIAWVAGDSYNSQWGKGTGLILLLAWLSPFLDLIASVFGKLHLAPLILAGLLIYLLARVAAGSRTADNLR